MSNRPLPTGFYWVLLFFPPNYCRADWLCCGVFAHSLLVLGFYLVFEFIRSQIRSNLVEYPVKPGKTREDPGKFHRIGSKTSKSGMLEHVAVSFLCVCRKKKWREQGGLLGFPQVRGLQVSVPGRARIEKKEKKGAIEERHSSERPTCQWLCTAS